MLFNYVVRPKHRSGQCFFSDDPRSGSVAMARMKSNVVVLDDVKGALLFLHAGSRVRGCNVVQWAPRE